MKNRARLQRVQLRRHVDAVDDVALMLDQQLRNESRDAGDLFAFLNQQIGQIVVQLHDLHRLDEERRA